MFYESILDVELHEKKASTNLNHSFIITAILWDLRICKNIKSKSNHSEVLIRYCLIIVDSHFQQEISPFHNTVKSRVIGKNYFHFMNLRLYML